MIENLWPEVRLGDLVQIKHGYAFDGAYFRDEPPGDVLLTPGNFAIGGGFKDDKFKYYVGAVPEEFVLAPGDLLVTMTDLSKRADTLGYPALVPKRETSRYLHNQRLGKVIIRWGVSLCKQFLYYLLRTWAYRNEVLAGATGTTVKHTSPQRIGSFRFHLPPMAEQEAMAAILANLDRKIELNRQMNETLETMAHAIFKSWFVDFDPVREKAEGRQLGGISADIIDKFPSACSETPIGLVPCRWAVGPITSRAQLLSGGTPKTGREDYWNGDILWASAKDVSQSRDTVLVATERTITKRGLNESATQLVPAWCTVVVARGATTGRMVLFGQEMAMNQTCYALESLIKAPLALYCQLRAVISDLVHAAHGSVFDTITTSTFANSLVVVPPDSLLLVFDRKVRPLFDLILANINESRTLAALSDGLLPKLISGEIRLKDLGQLIATEAKGV